MNITKKFVLTLAVLGAANAAYANPAAPGPDDNLRLKGRCLIDDLNHEAVWFDYALNERPEPLQLVDRDDFGNEIVTKIHVLFGFFDAMSVRFINELPAPLKANVGISDAAVGNRLTALIPIRLGKQADCDATIVKGE